MTARLLAACLATATVACMGQAQTGPDWSRALPIHGEVRIWGAQFASPEDANYGGFRVDLIGSRLTTWSFRMDSSNASAFAGQGFNLLHGGKDRELMVIFGFDQVANLKAGIGYSSPDTPERGRQGIGTFDVNYAKRFQKINFTLGLKGLLGRDSISVASLSAEYPLHLFHLSVFGEVGEPLWGDNTRSTSTGIGEQVTLGTIGLHLRLSTGTSVALDLTNAVGETTGFSMTPALGNRYGLRLKLGQRF